MKFPLKVSLFVGSLTLLIALLLIFGRTTLAGKTITQGDVTITERNELWEERLYLIGGMLGGLGFLVLLAGVAGIKTSRARDGTR